MSSLPSLIDQLSLMKRILGKLPKTEFSSFDYPLDRLMSLLAAPNHTFYPNVVVVDRGVSLPVNGFLVSIKVDPTGSPVKVNFDRPVSDSEYTTVFPGIVKVVGRLTQNLYLKAPAGQKSSVSVEILKLGA